MVIMLLLISVIGVALSTKKIITVNGLQIGEHEKIETIKEISFFLTLSITIFLFTTIFIFL